MPTRSINNDKVSPGFMPNMNWGYNPRQTSYDPTPITQPAPPRGDMFGGNPTGNEVQRILDQGQYRGGGTGQAIKDKYAGYGDLVRQKAQERFDTTPQGRVNGGFTQPRPLPPVNRYVSDAPTASPAPIRGSAAQAAAGALANSLVDPITRGLLDLTRAGLGKPRLTDEQYREAVRQRSWGEAFPGSPRNPGSPFTDPSNPPSPQPPGGKLNPPGGAANPKTPTNRDPRNPIDPTQPMPPSPGAPNTNIPPRTNPPPAPLTPPPPGQPQNLDLLNPPTLPVLFRWSLATQERHFERAQDGKLLNTLTREVTTGDTLTGIPIGFTVETVNVQVIESVIGSVNRYQVAVRLRYQHPNGELKQETVATRFSDDPGFSSQIEAIIPAIEILNVSQPLSTPIAQASPPAISDYQAPPIGLIGAPPPQPSPQPLLAPPKTPLQPVAPPTINPSNNPSPNSNPNGSPTRNPTGNPSPSPSNPPLVSPIPSPSPGTGNPSQPQPTFEKGWSEQSMRGLNNQFTPPNSSVSEVTAKEAEQLRNLYERNPAQQTQAQPNPDPRTNPQPTPDVTLNPAGPDGKLDPKAKERVEQKNNPPSIPSPTPEKCQDPCIADIQRKLDDQGNKEKLVKIKVKIFKACKASPQNDDDIAEFNSITLEVRSADATNTKLLYDRLFELEKEKCRSKFEIPETMALKVPDGRPILKITYREIGSQGKVKSSKWVVQVPHYSGGQQGVPKIVYSHGSTQVRYHFPDGSKVVINAKNETEGKRVVKGLLAVTNSAKRKGGKFYVSKSTTDSGEDNGIKAVKLTPISASFYAKGTGIVDGQIAAPTWTVKLRNQS